MHELYPPAGGVTRARRVQSFSAIEGATYSLVAWRLGWLGCVGGLSLPAWRGSSALHPHMSQMAAQTTADKRPLAEPGR
jgi:hypothetical protein